MGINLEFIDVRNNPPIIWMLGFNCIVKLSYFIPIENTSMKNFHYLRIFMKLNLVFNLIRKIRCHM